MLYPTHKRYGQLFGIAGLIASVSLSIIPTVTLDNKFSLNLFTFLMVYVGFRASMFGAEFPDIDSPGSVPARHYRFIRVLFDACNIKHRGKFSHDYFSILLFFGTIYLSVMAGFRYCWDNYLFVLVMTLYLCYFLARDIGNQVVFDMVKNKGARKRLGFIAAWSLTGVFAMCLIVLGKFPFSTSMPSLFETVAFIKPLYKVLIIFAFIGAYSHLFADMMTNEGVNIFGKRLSPAKVVLGMKKVPFIPSVVLGGAGFVMGGLLFATIGAVVGVAIMITAYKTDLKTGSAYEDDCRRIVVFSMIPMSMVFAYVLFGGQLSTLMQMFS